jgi:hypothetical protein
LEKFLLVYGFMLLCKEIHLTNHIFLSSIKIAFLLVTNTYKTMATIFFIVRVICIIAVIYGLICLVSWHYEKKLRVVRLVEKYETPERWYCVWIEYGVECWGEICVPKDAMVSAGDYVLAHKGRFGKERWEMTVVDGNVARHYKNDKYPNIKLI